MRLQLTLQIDIFGLYLSAECLVLRVSGRFEGSTAASHTNEHAGAGIHLLRANRHYCKKIKCGFLWVKVGSESPLTSTKDKVKQLAEDQVQGGVGNGGEAGGHF